MSGRAVSSTGRLWLLRLWRAGAVVILALLTGWQARRMAPPPREGGVALEEARLVIPVAAAIAPADASGHQAVYAADGSAAGSVLRTSPHSDHITGYSGVHDLLIGLSPEGGITGTVMLRSRDTPEHVAMVVADSRFWESLRGWTPGTPLPSVDAVSGATLTSSSMAEAVFSRLSGGSPSLRFPDAVSLEEIAALFPGAASFSGNDRLEVKDGAGRILGYTLRSAPDSDGVSGYRGPTESLIGLEPDGKTIRGVRVRKSYDTDSYVNQIREDEWYLKSFAGRTTGEIATMDFAAAGIEGVSGATQTSWALAEGMRRRFARKPVPAAASWQPAPRDWMAAGVVAGAVLLAFTRLRGIRWLRVSWQLLLMVWALWSGGDLISIALLAAWTHHGIPWAAAQGAALIAACAFLLPWLTRRQVYCHQICPHGAAQQWLGKLSRRKWTIKPRWDRLLSLTPWILLCAVPVCVLWGISLTRLEPFDAWIWRAGAVVPLVLAGAGLLASVFIPQAYCRYGCPTGALLAFVRSSGGQDGFGRRDWAFLVLLAVSVGGVSLAGSTTENQTPATRLTLEGSAMGTTWSVTLRDRAGLDAAALRGEISALLEAIENDLSNWRPGSSLSRINAAGTTGPQQAPSRLVELCRVAAGISSATGGAFDITAGPLVGLWGFGPPPRRTEPPSEREITEVLTHTGWSKVSVEGNSVQFSDPGTRIDLTALTEGHAADEIASLLKSRGVKEFLINMGGELLARGAWPVAIDHPMRTLLLHDGALGTSGTYRQTRQTAQGRTTHLIDPRMGRPVEHQTVSVSVRHPDCTLADAWATALNVLGSAEGLSLAEQWDIAAEFVDEDAQGNQQIQATRQWRNP